MTAPRAVALLLLVLPLLLQGASLPHTHFGGAGGLYNQEHDLTLLATHGGAAAALPAAAAVVVVLLVVAVTAVVPPRACAAVPGDADSRAPPAR